MPGPVAVPGLEGSACASLTRLLRALQACLLPAHARPRFLQRQPPAFTCVVAARRWHGQDGFSHDWLQLEAAGATSQLLFAPEGEGGTLLLTHNPGEAQSLSWPTRGCDLPARRRCSARADPSRRPTLNPQDNRMLPNTVEGVPRGDRKMRRHFTTASATSGASRRATSLLRVVFGESPPQWRIAARSSRRRARLLPIDGLTIGRDQLLDRRRAGAPRSPEVDGSLRYHPCCSSGSASTSTDAAPVPAGAPYATDQVSRPLRRQLRQRDPPRCRLAENGEGAALTGSFGSFPAYTVLDQLNFNEAGENPPPPPPPDAIAPRARRPQAAEPLWLGLGRRRCAERQAADPPFLQRGA